VSSAEHFTRTKISDLEAAVVCHQKVLGFEITVSNTTRVKVVNTTNKLLEHAIFEFV